MNKYVKKYLHRGLVFGGFGPLVTGIVYAILDLAQVDASVTGTAFFAAVLSTYLLAFVHAGASVFNQIEGWSTAKSLFFHFFSLYLAYSICYLINGWIAFSWQVFLAFTAIFVLGYGVVYLIVWLAVRQTARRLNAELHRHE